MLHTLDLDKHLEKKEYKQQRSRLQERLHELALQLYELQRSLVVVCEGWDASGKGGAIRRITQKLDPRGFRVFQIAAPEGEDRTHHYLWRFWRRLEPPRDRQILIFDRSWYGRVLVERVEGFARVDEWQRAYREINEFERQLIEHDILLAKLWFHIDKDEQKQRFEARRNTPHKRWKLTDEDWRNREKWDLYEQAVQDMLVKTSTSRAPWTIVEANDKYYARVKALTTLTELLAAALDPPKPRQNASTKKKKKR